MKVLSILAVLFLLVSCGGSSGSGSTTGGTTGYTTEADAEAGRLSTVETDLLALINQERQDSGLPALVRDVGLDLIMLWHVSKMATDNFLDHTDENGRSAGERVQFYSGNNTIRCSEIIQWWGGAADGQTHYQGYFNSTEHHNAYMEVGIYNLGGAVDVGIASLNGNGPDGTQYEGVSGSYSGLVICDQGVTIQTNPFQ